MLDPDYITANTSTRESSYAELTPEAMFKMLRHFVKHLDLVDNKKIPHCGEELYEYYNSQAKRLRDTLRETVDVESLSNCQRELLTDKRKLNMLMRKAAEMAKCKPTKTIMPAENEIVLQQQERTTVIVKRKENSMSLDEVRANILQIIPTSQEEAKTFGFFTINIQNATQDQLQQALESLVSSGKVFKCKQKSSIIYFGAETQVAVNKCIKSEVVKYLHANRGQFFKASSIAFQLGSKESDLISVLKELRDDSRIVAKFLNVAGTAERHYGV